MRSRARARRNVRPYTEQLELFDVIVENWEVEMRARARTAVTAHRVCAALKSAFSQMQIDAAEQCCELMGD